MCLWRTWMTLLKWTQCTEPLQQLTLLQGKSQHRKQLSAFKSIFNNRKRKQQRFPDPFQVLSWNCIWGTIFRNSTLVMCHYPNLLPTGWSKFPFSHVAQPIRSTTQIWVVTHHQYGIYPLFFSDIILQGNQWWCLEMSAVFLGSWKWLYR